MGQCSQYTPGLWVPHRSGWDESVFLISGIQLSTMRAGCCLNKGKIVRLETLEQNVWSSRMWMWVRCADNSKYVPFSSDCCVWVNIDQLCNFLPLHWLQIIKTGKTFVLFPCVGQTRPSPYVIEILFFIYPGLHLWILTWNLSLYQLSDQYWMKTVVDKGLQEIQRESQKSIHGSNSNCAKMRSHGRLGQTNKNPF